MWDLSTFTSAFSVLTISNDNSHNKNVFRSLPEKKKRPDHYPSVFVYISASSIDTCMLLMFIKDNNVLSEIKGCTAGVEGLSQEVYISATMPELFLS